MSSTILKFPSAPMQKTRDRELDRQTRDLIQRLVDRGWTSEDFERLMDAIASLRLSGPDDGTF